MTAPRIDNHSTEFGLWLREQKEIDSELGHVATNIDYMWQNYKNGNWMLIEEKRHNAQVKFWQQRMFDILNWCGKHHPRFKGFHIIVFEDTSPDDGTIYLNGKEITKRQLIKFLRFEADLCELRRC